MRVLAATALLVCGTLQAQAYIETFPYPDGPTIPLWTNQTLTFTIKNQRLVPSGARSPHYITSDLFKDVENCVQDIDVFYPAATSLHYGGVCARHPGGSGENGLVMLKLQDNSSGGTYNSTWLYERPGASQANTTFTPTKAGTLRLIIKGTNAWQQLDGDMDGIFEVTNPPKALVAPTTQTKGLVGITGYNLAEMDNYKFYDGVLIEDPTAGNLPKIGTKYAMVFNAPLVNAVPTPWLGAFSLGKKGIPLGDGRMVPLSIDPLLLATLGMNLGGLLTSANPDGTLVLPIPNLPALIGLTVYAGAFTVDASKALSIGAISNEHAFTIQ